MGVRCASRSPHGERGLKCACSSSRRTVGSRSPHGERGLKCVGKVFDGVLSSRSPHGERGLKFSTNRIGARVLKVALLMESVD